MYICISCVFSIYVPYVFPCISRVCDIFFFHAYIRCIVCTYRMCMICSLIYKYISRIYHILIVYIICISCIHHVEYIHVHTFFFLYRAKSVYHMYISCGLYICTPLASQSVYVDVVCMLMGKEVVTQAHAYRYTTHTRVRAHTHTHPHTHTHQVTNNTAMLVRSVGVDVACVLIGKEAVTHAQTRTHTHTHTLNTYTHTHTHTKYVHTYTHMHTCTHANTHSHTHQVTNNTAMPVQSVK